MISLYSSFLQRAYDQIIHDVCIQKLPVVICIDRAGVVGNDGETHQGVFDLSFLSTVPNLTIMAPKDFKELENMLEFALQLQQPVCIRYPRGGEQHQFEEQANIEYGKAEVIKNGTDITIITIGNMVSRALEISSILECENISAEIINARFQKPLDKITIQNSIIKTKKVLTIEDNIIIGGLGTQISNIINEQQLENVKIHKIGYPDEFIKHGSIQQIEKQYGLDAESIAKLIKTIV